MKSNYCILPFFCHFLEDKKQASNSLIYKEIGRTTQIRTGDLYHVKIPLIMIYNKVYFTDRK